MNRTVIPLNPFYQVSTLALLDESILRELFAEVGVTEKAYELLDLFVVEMYQRLEDIKLASLVVDMNRLRIESHTLKSICSALGVLRLQELAWQIEVASRDFNVETALDLIASLQVCVDATARAIENYRFVD